MYISVKIKGRPAFVACTSFIGACRHSCLVDAVEGWGFLLFFISLRSVVGACSSVWGGALSAGVDTVRLTLLSVGWCCSSELRLESIASVKFPIQKMIFIGVGRHRDDAVLLVTWKKRTKVHMLICAGNMGM